MKKQTSITSEQRAAAAALISSPAITRCIVAPPTRLYLRPRRWETFERLFDPITREDGSLLWNPGELQPFYPLDCREWWTVLDCDGKLLVATGLHYVNRLGYVRCKNLWGGEHDAHPEYYY